MAVRIRLMRCGRKNDPHYRVVVAHSTNARDSRAIEIVGHYHPRMSKDADARLKINVERIQYWLQCGAWPSDRVAKFILDSGVALPAHVQKHVDILKAQYAQRAEKFKAKKSAA